MSLRHGITVYLKYCCKNQSNQICIFDQITVFGLVANSNTALIEASQIVWNLRLSVQVSVKNSFNNSLDQQIQFQYSVLLLINLDYKYNSFQQMHSPIAIAIDLIMAFQGLQMFIFSYQIIVFNLNYNISYSVFFQSINTNLLVIFEAQFHVFNKFINQRAIPPPLNTVTTKTNIMICNYCIDKLIVNFFSIWIWC
ncbi:hypothetical protein SS50377_27872 [Spironucleus salmonicida]|uniref:Uncharacterized protein n=1 Tax=Spironucleus salmonicida TaxID=348837 RepID=V6LX46_9EUKA|nr:hypothetical protein SS50377_27872 [Spironucleus salmonicida]|eukprot:EST48813.1 Hypothetical protein SS50377_jh022 [Spironucleus salmonicida]